MPAARSKVLAAAAALLALVAAICRSAGDAQTEGSAPAVVAPLARSECDARSDEVQHGCRQPLAFVDGLSSGSRRHGGGEVEAGRRRWRLLLRQRRRLKGIQRQALQEEVAAAAAGSSSPGAAAVGAAAGDSALGDAVDAVLSVTEATSKVAAESATMAGELLGATLLLGSVILFVVTLVGVGAVRQRGDSVLTSSPEDGADSDEEEFADPESQTAAAPLKAVETSPEGGASGGRADYSRAAAPVIMELETPRTPSLPSRVKVVPVKTPAATDQPASPSPAPQDIEPRAEVAAAPQPDVSSIPAVVAFESTPATTPSVLSPPPATPSSGTLSRPPAALPKRLMRRRSPAASRAARALASRSAAARAEFDGPRPAIPASTEAMCRQAAEAVMAAYRDGFTRQAVRLRTDAAENNSVEETSTQDIRYLLKASLPLVRSFATKLWNGGNLSSLKTSIVDGEVATLVYREADIPTQDAAVLYMAGRDVVTEEKVRNFFESMGDRLVVLANVEQAPAAWRIENQGRDFLGLTGGVDARAGAEVAKQFQQQSYYFYQGGFGRWQLAFFHAYPHPWEVHVEDAQFNLVKVGEWQSYPSFDDILQALRRYEVANGLQPVELKKDDFLKGLKDARWPPDLPDVVLKDSSNRRSPDLAPATG
eukprot:TRINITY_DN120907_c0_g1_i1.p1 TRINITY_DN120907_c0_g1~~TRINITY_DN120907_c0_g1_i1.p1  ORF type:complete len:652 (+),score=146.22 TRINITY_DN120907_c0_g1_i1:160-2115(+)